MEAAINYYEHHIGDFAEATAHLSFVEDAAYSRLIRKYYAQEKPLPADVKAVQRLVGARSKDEREAVESVLNEFFDLQPDGWHQARCDAEIARYQDKQAKAKRSAQARWSAKPAHSEGNANASPNAMRTHSEGNAHQTPDTSHQSPDPNTHTETSPPPMARAPSLAGQVCMAMKAAGVADVNPGHIGLLRLIEAGATLDEFIGAASEARAKSKGFAYAVGTVQRRREEAAMANPLHQGAMPQRPPTQAELNSLAHGFATGVYGPATFEHAPQPQPETVDVDSRLIAP
jgi:uncharacterized protein YdaU (DUF1376 family)